MKVRLLVLPVLLLGLYGCSTMYNVDRLVRDMEIAIAEADAFISALKAE